MELQISFKPNRTMQPTPRVDETEAIDCSEYEETIKMFSRVSLRLDPGLANQKIAPRNFPRGFRLNTNRPGISPVPSVELSR